MTTKISKEIEHALILVEAIQDKITNQEYRDLMEALMGIHNTHTPRLPRTLNDQERSDRFATIYQTLDIIRENIESQNITLNNIER